MPNPGTMTSNPKASAPVKSWFRMKAAADTQSADIYIYRGISVHLLYGLGRRLWLPPPL